MGLLSKAALGSKQDEKTHGGLLKLISEKLKDEGPNHFEELKMSPSTPLEKAVMGKLLSCYEKFGIFQGIIIEALKYSAGEFTGRLSFMVSGFGIAQGLAPGRALIIFSRTHDSILLGTHLAKTVPGKNIYNFLAHTPEEAFSFIKPYL